MRVFSLRMNCGGDEDHKPHNDPVILITVANKTTDLPDLLAMEITCMLLKFPTTRVSISGDTMIEFSKELLAVIHKYVEDQKREESNGQVLCHLSEHNGGSGGSGDDGDFTEEYIEG